MVRVLRAPVVAVMEARTWPLRPRFDLTRGISQADLIFSRPRSEGWPHYGRILSPFIPVLCHSDRLFHGESCPRLDVVHPGRAWPSSPSCTWHCSLHNVSHVETYARCGGIVNIHLTRNLQGNLTVKKNFNRFRFDRILAMSLWPHFFGPPCIFYSKLCYLK